MDTSHYPQLRLALSGHLRAVGDLVDLCLADAAREALGFAAAIAAELELDPR